MLPVTAFALLGAAFSPAPTQADVPSLDLKWSTPQACPDQADVRRRVANLLEGGTLRMLTAEGTITVADATWTLTLAFEGTTKVVDGDSCEEVTDAAAVILSLALSPREPTREPTQASESELGSTQPARDAPRLVKPDPPPVTRPQPPPVSRHEPTARVEGIVRLDAGGGVGVTPTFTIGQLGVGVSGRRARGELVGTLWTPADASEERGSGYRTRVTMGTVGLRGCGVLRSAKLAFPLCGGAELGALRVGDTAPDRRRVTHRLWPSVTASAALLWMFHRNAGLWIGLEGVVGLRPRPSVELLDSTSRYRAGPAAIRAGLGIEVHFASRIRRPAGNTRR